MNATQAMPKIISFPKQQRAPKRKPKRKMPAVLCCLCLLVAYFTYMFVSQEFELRRLRKQEAELRQTYLELLAKQNELKSEIKLLHTDDYIERLARDRLGLIKPKDKILMPVYIVPTP